jgi:hypothetical protein
MSAMGAAELPEVPAALPQDSPRNRAAARWAGAAETAPAARPERLPVLAARPELLPVLAARPELLPVLAARPEPPAAWPRGPGWLRGPGWPPTRRPATRRPACRSG